MASTVINMTNYTHKAGSLTFHGGDISTPRSHSVKQFHLPKKSTVSASCLPRSRRQQLTVSSVLTATAFSNSPSTSFTFSTEPSTSSSSSSSSSSCSLPLMWREIHGSSDWEGLLDPIHPLLRDEIIRYGKFVTACYEAFDLDPNSRRYLNCKYGKRNMLVGVGLEDSGYEVTKYIYATPDVSIPIGPSCGRWIGYVAVSSDAEVKRLGRRDVVITFRGTVTNPEWVANFMSSLTPARLDPHNPRPEVKVESGFLSLYTADESESRFGISSCREQLLSEVSRLMNKYKGEKLSITLAGHSMGSSLALLLAYDISELGLNNTVNNKNNPVVQEKVPVTVFSFGGPRVGNSAFKERCEELGIKVLRVVNVNDPITKLPGVFLNENFRDLGGRYEFPWSCSCYAHVGVELALDFFNVQNPSCVHDLGTYLSLLHDCSLQKQRDHEDRSNNITTSADDHHNFLQKARELFLGAPNFNMLPWIHAAGSMVTLIPIISSQWT